MPQVEKIIKTRLQPAVKTILVMQGAKGVDEISMSTGADYVYLSFPHITISKANLVKLFRESFFLPLGIDPREHKVPEIPLIEKESKS